MKSSTFLTAICQAATIAGHIQPPFLRHVPRAILNSTLKATVSSSDDSSSASSRVVWSASITTPSTTTSTTNNLCNPTFDGYRNTTVDMLPTSVRTLYSSNISTTSRVTSGLSTVTLTHVVTLPPTTSTTIVTITTTNTWDIAIYATESCSPEGNGDNGQYYVLNGPAWPELSNSVECISFPPSNYSTDMTDDTNINCRFFTDGGTSWTGCSTNTFSDPKSWRVKGGRCQVFISEDCANDEGEFDYYLPEGCHTSGDYEYQDMKNWRSIKCFSLGDVAA